MVRYQHSMLFFSLASLLSLVPSWCARPTVSLGSPPLSLAVEASRHSLPRVRQQLPEELWYFSEVFVFSPSGMQFFSVWVVSAFACGWLFHCAEEVFFLCFLPDSGIFLRPVACLIAALFSYTLLGSQSQLDKVSWGYQHLLLSFWNSEIKTTLQNN